MTETKENALEMGIDLVFGSRRIIRRKKLADESSLEEVVRSYEEEFGVTYLLHIMNQASSYLLLGLNNFKYMRVLSFFL